MSPGHVPRAGSAAAAPGPVASSQLFRRPTLLWGADNLAARARATTLWLCAIGSSATSPAESRPMLSRPLKSGSATRAMRRSSGRSSAVMALMRASDTWEEFYYALNRALPRQVQGPLLLRDETDADTEEGEVVNVPYTGRHGRKT